jgi:hypothetical protein
MPQVVTRRRVERAQRRAAADVAAEREEHDPPGAGGHELGAPLLVRPVDAACDGAGGRVDCGQVPVSFVVQQQQLPGGPRQQGPRVVHCRSLDLPARRAGSGVVGGEHGRVRSEPAGVGLLPDDDHVARDSGGREQRFPFPAGPPRAVSPHAPARIHIDADRVQVSGGDGRVGEIGVGA